MYKSRIYTLVLLFCIISLSSGHSSSQPQNCLLSLAAGVPLFDPYDYYSISTNPNDVKFYLYPNALNTNDYDLITFNGSYSNVKSSRYNSSLRTKFLIHGFTNYYGTYGLQAIKNEYLKNGFGNIYNIIIVDWSKLATPSPILNKDVRQKQLSLGLYEVLTLAGYPLAVCNVDKVGSRVGNFTTYLKNKRLLPKGGFSNIHIIGHSLGAMVAGFAGKQVQVSNPGQKIGRITGLDPAGPYYQQINFPPSQRLNPTDASLVDVIHTNAGEMGYEGNIGHVDFYVNGGTQQPVCTNLNLLNLTENPLNSTASFVFCSHSTAYFYYAASIPANDHPTGCSCLVEGPICVPISACLLGLGRIEKFGEKTPQNARGAYVPHLEFPPKYIPYLAYT